MCIHLRILPAAPSVDNINGSPHTYQIETIPSHAMFVTRCGPTVTFGTTNNLPRPSPAYLKIHATCAQVAYLSGESEWARNRHNDRDKYVQDTLAKNGTSASLLYNALWAHVMGSDAAAWH